MKFKLNSLSKFLFKNQNQMIKIKFKIMEILEKSKSKRNLKKSCLIFKLKY